MTLLVRSSFCLLLLSYWAEAKHIRKDVCTIDLRQDASLPEIAPILTNYHQDWILPTADSKITLEIGSVMRISCPGSGFKNDDLSTSQFWTTICVSGSEFLIEDLNNLIYDYADLGCNDWPKETVTEKEGESCGPDNIGKVIEIGFAVSENNPNNVLITSCLDPTTYQTFWSRHVVPKEIDQRNFHGDMPYFSDDGLYDFQLEVYLYYTKNMQRDTIAVLVGSESLADEYVEESGNVYMARGHLAPKADFMYTSWQIASYHYVNVQAQWQVFNGGNWLYLENGLRDFVIGKGKDFLVITGSHGICELDDVNANKREIHLNLERPDLARLPVPRFYWKMLVDESQELGVVVIGVNNPHLLESETESYRLCPKINDHPLLDNVYHPDDIVKGIIYACSVADAQKVIPEIPSDIVVNGILSHGLLNYPNIFLILTCKLLHTAHP